MKLNTTLFGATLITIFSLPASAAVVAYFETGSTYPGTAPVEAFNYADGVAISDFTAHGTTSRRSGDFRVIGWSTTLNESNYAGFIVTPELGFRMTLTELVHATCVSSGTVNAFRWGYRTNEGSGYSAWTFDETYATGDAGFAFVGTNAKTWDFSDIVTTGSVEFGLFARATSSASNIIIAQPEDLLLNGNVSAVPEPSAILLSAIAGLTLLHRRR